MAGANPKVIDPLWIAADLADLDNNLELRFYSAHDNVINFIVACRTKILMIASPALEKGPSAIGLSRRDFLNLKNVFQQYKASGVILQDSFEFDLNSERLFINRCGEEVIAFAPVNRFLSNKERANPALQYYINELTLRVVSLSDSSALSLFNLPGGEEYIRNTFSYNLPDLITALIKRDLSLFLEKASRIIGLGRGFSPEGDDLIYGALLAHHYFDYDPQFIEALQEASVSLLKSTNIMGAHLITMGLKGLAAESVTQFIMSLANEIGNYSILEEVLNIGHTTGIANIVAILFYLDSIDRHI